jgi:DNA-binding GntR family transcriptional regulator
MITPKPPATKSEFIYQQVRREIVEGQLQPGQRLRLAELAERFGISEMPVREALRRLQHDDLIQFENHRGATVSDLGLERTIEIIAVRTYLEVFALTEAVPFHDEKSIKQLRALVTSMRRIKDPDQYSDLNRRFHKLLIEPCPNAFVKTEIDGLWNKVWKTRGQSIFQLVPKRLADATREHEEIFEAIVDGKAEQARCAAMAHREQTLDNWRKLLGEGKN